MSKRSSDASRRIHHGPSSGFEALQSGSELRGPVKRLEGDEGTDHFGFIYETQEEQFATVVPYVREGIDRGERCMYIATENSPEEILAALRSGGVDADAALETGQLSIHSAEEIYLDDGEFDVEEACTLLEAAVEEALTEYEGFRVTAEETWLIERESVQMAFMMCETQVNDLFDGKACMALCQYNQDRLPAAVIEDVLETHPYLIYDDTICQNFYYTPPEEYFGPPRPSRENERKLETLVDRTDARVTLRTRDRFQRALHEIMSRPDRSFEEKLDSVFQLGCERFGLDLGGLARVDPESDLFEVEAVSGEHDQLVPGARVDLSETYCRVVTDGSTDTDGGPVDVTDPVSDGFEGDLCYERFGVRAYLGTYLEIDGDADRTFWFVSTEPREEGFSEAERTFHHQMGQWVKYELERRRRERELRRTKNRFETVFENSNDAIFINDPYEDEIVDANSAGLELLGYDHEELLSLGPSDCHPDEMDRFREFVDGTLEEGYGWTDELSCRTKDGEDIPAEISASPIELEDRELLLAVVRDITERKEHERYQRELYETIAEPQTPFATKIEQLLELGSERFGLDIGYFTRTSDDDTFEIVEAVGSHDLIEAGVSDSICDTYCEKLLASPGPISVRDAAEVGWTDDPAYERFGLDAYFATTVHAGGEEYGTLCFASETPREHHYTEAERTFLDLMGQWVSYELGRQRRERYLQESYEITSDPALPFEEKLDRLLEVGCEWFGLEMAGLNYLPSWEGKFRLEKGVGLELDAEPEDEALWTDPSMGCFCRQTIAADAPVDMADVRDTDWADDSIHRELGLTSYLGTKITSGSSPYGTLWFGSTEPRGRPFSDAERTFIDLLGQWVSYEIERREHNRSQRELYEITADPDLATDEKIERLLESGCERLDLPVGMLTREHEGAFEIETMHGSHPDLGEGTITPPMTDNYCRRVVDTGESISVANAGTAGWDSDALYHEFGLECYAGVDLIIGDDAYGTICFTDTSPRGAEFTEAEQTFLELIGQCVSYELEQAQREDRLHALNTLGRELMDAETATAVGECIIDSTADTLDLPVAAVVLYDDEAGELRPVAHTDAAAELIEATSLLDGTDDIVRAAFMENEATRMCDLLADAATPIHPPVSEVAVQPLGDHGVLLVGTSTTDGFGEDDAEFIETVTANAEAAYDRVEREQQLVESEERYRTLVEHFPDGAVGLFDEQLNYTAIGGELLDQIGVSPDDRIGHRVYDLYPDELLEEVKPYFLAALEGEMNSFETEFHDRYLVAHTLPVRDADDEIFAGMLVMQDITDRIEYERELAALNRLNEVIRDISLTAAEATSREEIEERICEQLAETDPYVSAWMGHIERGRSTVTPDAIAGIEEGSHDEIEVPLDDTAADQGPTERAIRTDEPQFVHDIPIESSVEPWHEQTDERGYRSSAALPITHEGVSYGVLNVYAEESYAFDGPEGEMLAELGELMGHAIYAVEQRQALVSDTATELEFCIADAEHLLLEATSDGEASITFERRIPAGGDQYVQFVTVRGMGHERFETAVEKRSAVTNVECLVERDDEFLFEITSAPTPVAEALAVRGGSIREMTITEGALRIIAEVPSDADVREVLDSIEEIHPGMELLAQRTTARSDTTRQKLHGAVTDRLTDKQRAALEAAYFAGYFEWPRVSNGEDVAELLDISAPTFAEHIRGAQRKLFEAVFDERNAAP